MWSHVKNAGAVAGAIIALAGLCKVYAELGLPTVAWSQDVERLENQQIDTAIEVYQQKQRALTINKGEVERAGGGGSREHQYISEELGETAAALKALRERKIELSK